LGLSKEFAVTFSFVLGMPAVLGASLLQVGDILKAPEDFHLSLFVLGAVISAVVGILSIWLVRRLIKSGKFIVFAYYTAALGVFTIAYAALEKLRVF